MNASEIGTRSGLSASNDEMSAAVPADTDTDTVRMYPTSRAAPATWAGTMPKLSRVTRYAPPADG